MGIMIQQMQTVCQDCKGKGQTIREKDRCQRCGGNKVIPEEKQLEVHIDKGMQTGQKLTFYGEGEQEPGIEAGDIVVILKEKRDDRNLELFKRQDNDLVYEHKITLVVALTGFKFYIKHLDERYLLVTSELNSITKPGDIKVVSHEGMPIHKQSYKGDLLIRFDVVFPLPDQLDDPKRAKLKEILPKPTPTNLPPNAECVIDEVEATDYVPNSRRTRRDEDMDDDDDERPRGTQAQCMHCIM
jgi:DnaJ-class molecular chaperone